MLRPSVDGATKSKKSKTNNKNNHTQVLVRDDEDEAQMYALRYNMFKAVNDVLEYLKKNNDYCDASTIRIIHLMKNGQAERTILFRVPKSLPVPGVK